jgi:hypothetical protein
MPIDATPTHRLPTDPHASDEPFPDYYNDLSGSLRHAWQSLGRATKDRRSAFHAPVVATNSDDGPQARVMILRSVDAALQQLNFYTDMRSAKTHALAQDARVAVTFYDAARKLQLRANGVGVLHTGDAVAQARWHASSPSSLRCYAGDAPGDITPQPSSGLPATLEGRVPKWAELAAGQMNFAVLTVTVARMEWLYLHTRGQRRALFEWAGGDCAMHWVNP